MPDVERGAPRLSLSMSDMTRLEYRLYFLHGSCLAYHDTSVVTFDDRVFLFLRIVFFTLVHSTPSPVGRNPKTSYSRLG